MLEPIPTVSETFPPLWGERRLAAFALRDAPRPDDPSERPTQGAEPRAEVAEALARLASAGLVARAPRGPRLRIVGGTSKSTDSDITAYQEGFIIALERDGTFFVGVAGPGNLGQEAHAATLSSATDAVLDVYRKRRPAAGTTPPR